MYLFFIIVFVLIAVYASVHPYVKNYCKGRLWVSIVLKILLALFWVYNFCCYCDWFGTTVTFQKFGLWGLLFDNRPGSSEYGDVYMTSFCGLLTMFLPIVLIFDKKMTIVRFLFPVGFFGGSVTLFRLFTYSTNDSIWSAVLFSNMGFIFRHMCLVVVCAIGLLNTPKYIWRKDLPIYLIGIAVCYLYGLVIGFAIIPPGSRLTVFGLFIDDYSSGGSYELVGTWMSIYPLNMILVTIITILGPIGLVALKEVCCRKIPYYRNVPKIFKKNKIICN